MPRPTRGRPTEERAPVSEALRFRVTPEELAGLKAVAAREGVTVSRLLRRAVREMVTGGPDFFDDGTARMSELARELAAVQRLLSRLPVSERSVPSFPDAFERIMAALTSTRTGFAEQVRRSRRRWVPMPPRPRSSAK